MTIVDVPFPAFLFIMGLALLPAGRLGGQGGGASSGLLYAAGAVLAGWLLYLPHERYPFLIVNKSMGTPPWCLFSAAMTAACLVAAHRIVERGVPATWSSLPRLAGTNALLAYILALPRQSLAVGVPERAR